MGRLRVGQAGAAAADGVGHRGDRLVLADDPLVQHLLEADELVHLALHQPRHGHAGPLAHDLGDVLLVDLLLQHLLRRPAARRARLVASSTCALELGDLAVADLGRLLEVGLALELGALGLELLLELADRGDGVLLGLPVGLHAVGLLLQVGQLLVERGEPLLRRRVGLLGQRDPLDLELADAPLDDVDLGRHRVDLDAQLATRPRRRGRWPCRAGSGR